MESRPVIWTVTVVWILSGAIGVKIRNIKVIAQRLCGSTLRISQRRALWGCSKPTSILAWESMFQNGGWMLSRKPCLFCEADFLLISLSQTQGLTRYWETVLPKLKK